MVDAMGSTFACTGLLFAVWLTVLVAVFHSLRLPISIYLFVSCVFFFSYLLRNWPRIRFVLNCGTDAQTIVAGIVRSSLYTVCGQNHLPNFMWQANGGIGKTLENINFGLGYIWECNVR